MEVPRPLAVDDASGFQHANDEYYYRPLASGDELFTYVAHVPAGGVMAPDAEEAKLFELSLFMLDGERIGTLGTDDMPMRPGEALHTPRGVAFGPLRDRPHIQLRPELLAAATLRGHCADARCGPREGPSRVRTSRIRVNRWRAGLPASLNERQGK